MKTILFQGDSITDCGRNYADPGSLGAGYPRFVAGQLGHEEPNAYKFYNRGISGNRTVDLYARIRKPDYMSVLMGVNDAGHEFWCQNGIPVKKFKKVYGMILEETLEALPDLTIVLIEPFLQTGGATDGFYPEFRYEVDLRRAAVRELAGEFRLPLIPLQEELDRLSEAAGPQCWLADGVHPTAAFHHVIAERWIEMFLEWENK